jgi:hypothetical protein
MKALRTVSPKILALGGGGVLVVAVAAWGVSGYLRTPQKPPPPDPMKLMENMQRTDLTEEQRNELRHNMHEAFQARMDARADEYFTAPAEQKELVLDRQIDEMQKEMKQMEERRRQHQEEEERHAGPTSRPWHRGFANMTPQERKTRSETRNPDQMARHMAYRNAVHARMEQRGIQMPFGPRGRRGPRG